MTGQDPTEQSLWRPLRLLLDAMDAEIAAVYGQADVEGLKPTWVHELLRLHARGPMTIAELARSVQRTHSAMSQKVAAMRAAGWVRVTAGPDARSKRVTLTRKAGRAVGKLAAEWRATEASIAELEAEIPYSLSQVVTDIAAALGRKSFRDRIAERLDEDPEWNNRLGSAHRAEVPAKAEARGRRSFPAVRTEAFLRVTLIVLVLAAHPRRGKISR